MGAYNEKLAWCIKHAPKTLKNLPDDKLLAIMESSYNFYLKNKDDDSVVIESLMVEGIDECYSRLPFTFAHGLYQIFALMECKSFYTENIVENIYGLGNELLKDNHQLQLVKRFYNEDVHTYHVYDCDIVQPTFDQVLDRYRVLCNSIYSDSVNYWDSSIKSFVKRVVM